MRLLLATLALVLLVSACGGGVDLAEDDPEQSGQQQDPTRVPINQIPTLRPGDCFNDQGSLASASDSVPCAEPHLFEVFSFEETSGRTFPGDAELNSRGEVACDAEFLERTGVVDDISMLVSFWLVPSEESWSQGDRFIVCAVQYPARTAQTFDEIDPIRSFGMASTYQLEADDCFVDLDTSLIGARLISCDSPHRFEVYASTDLADGPWPGDAAIAALESDFCTVELENFLGGARSDVVVSILGPDEAAWTDLGSRRVACLLDSADNVSGSQRGTGSAEAAPVVATQDPLEELTSSLFGGDLDSGLWISVADMNSNVISLQWDPIPGADSYTLSRVEEAAAASGSPADWSSTVVFEGSAAGHIDDSVTPGGEYRYLLQATGPGLETGIQWRAAAAVSDFEAPNQVDGLIGFSTDQGFLLQWSPSTDNYRFAVYEVFRGTDSGSLDYYDTVWSQQQTSFVDSAPPRSGDWFYEVYAVDFHGNTSEPAQFQTSFG